MEFRVIDDICAMQDEVDACIESWDSQGLLERLQEALCFEGPGGASDALLALSTLRRYNSQPLPEYNDAIVYVRDALRAHAVRKSQGEKSTGSEAGWEDLAEEFYRMTVNTDYHHLAVETLAAYPRCLGD